MKSIRGITEFRARPHGDSNVSLTTRAQGAKGKPHEELQCIVESDHASHPAHRVRHRSCRGFHGLAAATRPRRPIQTATRAVQHPSARGQHGVSRGSRRRHPELCLRTLSLLKLGLRLCALHTGGNTLTKTTFIQRVNTSKGVAPSTGCASFSDVGNQAFAPYTADYIFYTDR